MIRFEAQPLSMPQNMSIKATLAWKYLGINNGGWLAARICNGTHFGSGNDGIIVSDESGDLTNGGCFSSEDAFTKWLEAIADEQLDFDPAEFLMASGAVCGELLNHSVMAAILSTLNNGG